MTHEPRICQICAEDCSDRPRVRDSRGRYYCRACALSAASSSSQQSLPQDFFDSSTEPPDAKALDIEPDRPTSRGVCPSCFRPLPPDTGVCVTCSAANKRGAGSGAPTCQKCGYDLTGATSLICPECGTTQRPRSSKNLDMSREVIRDAYLKPAIAMVLGFVAVTVYLLAYGAPDMIPSTLLAILIQSAVGLAIFWICSAVWIGFDEPFRINVMRLLAIYSISWTILLIALSLPFLCTVSVIVPAIIFMLLHKKMLDLDFPDAVLVSVITGAVWIFVFVIMLT